jgi:hypothetical protein
VFISQEDLTKRNTKRNIARKARTIAKNQHRPQSAMRHIEAHRA